MDRAVYTAMVNSFHSYRLLGGATSARESFPRRLCTPSNHSLCSLKCVCVCVCMHTHTRTQWHCWLFRLHSS